MYTPFVNKFVSTTNTKITRDQQSKRCSSEKEYVTYALLDKKFHFNSPYVAAVP